MVKNRPKEEFVFLSKNIAECGYYIDRGRGYCGLDLVPCKQRIADLRGAGQICWTSSKNIDPEEKQAMQKLREMNWREFLQKTEHVQKTIKRSLIGLLERA